MAFNRSTLRKLDAGQSVTAGGITYERLAGDGRWVVNVMVNRERHHRVVGLESEGYTLTQAQEVVAELKARKRTQAHGVAAPRQSGRYTLDKAADEYLAWLPKHNGKDIEGKEARFRLHLKRLLGHHTLDRLTDDHWTAYTATRRSEGATDATINRERSALLHLLRTAVKRRLLRAVPCHLERQKESAGKLVYLSPEQLGRLIEAAAADQSPHSLPFVMIAGFTGVRQEPILALRARDIDCERRVIWIGKDKAGRREQPMPAILADYLARYTANMEPDDYLFATPKSKRGRVYQINSRFARCVASAGLSADVTPHTMRHTVATNAARAGLDAATIQAIGGWKTRAMAERYTHAAHMTTAMDALQSHLTGDAVTQKLQRASLKPNVGR